MIFFNIDKVRGYLLQNGIVYTLRKRGRREGRDEAVKGDLKHYTRVATVHVQRITEARQEVTNPQELLPYVEKSGLYNEQDGKLASAIAWYSQAKELHKNEPLQLYAVTVIRG